MSNNLMITEAAEAKAQKTEFVDVDGLVKFALATVLAVLPFLLEKPLSMAILSLYLVFVTLLSRIKPKTIVLSAASYGIVVLFPYLFGIFINSLFAYFSSNIFLSQQGAYDSFLRLFRLFIIWYVSILYFHTTPMKTVIGLLDKLLTPLKFFRVPVEDYLKVVMCIVIELTETGAEMKKSLGESMRSAMGGAQKSLRINIKGISQIIVSLIVNSFEKIDKVQSFVEKANSEELYSYRFKWSKADSIATLSFILFILLVLLIEKNVWTIS